MKPSELVVVASVAGRVISMADVPDPVFAAALVGPGVAIDPNRSGPSRAVAPVGGRVVTLHPHAFIIQAPDGAGVLTHLGIDTVQLTGEGFELHVMEGDQVTVGQAVVTWDPAVIADGGRSPIVPIVALEAAVDALVDVHPPGPVAVGDTLFTWAR